MRTARHGTLLALGLILAAPAPGARAGEPALLGFDADGARQQREIEARFDAQLQPENLRQRMQRLSARPHHVGSAYGKENAEFIAEQFRAWGYDTQIETFDVLFPTPVKRLLELIEPRQFTAALEEPVLPEDASTGQAREQLPTYNAYSPDGDVTAELVYVNRGVPDDYKDLERLGIDVKGKIVIARYGGSWRGIKPKLAAEHGAVGCIIYSDPRDDGYFRGETYPRGAFRSENGVQRGSVADMPVFPGDPLTPFLGATKGARRLQLAEAPTIAKIPVLPISHRDALPLLQALAGPVAPERWRGALPLTYRIGPGPAKVRLQLKFDWSLTPALDVIAKLPGTERPEQWIVRGNHHDAWVNGADDPISGLVALMEEARAIGELVKTGWKPRRTIVFAAWDAEEPGLLGSTEWVEAHAEELRRHAVAYVNSDSNGRGFLYAGGSHTLEKLLNEAARDVTDPQKQISVLDRAKAALILEGKASERKEARDRADLRIEALGSGSDYTPFLQHLGVASLNIGYGGEDGGGSYHSIYDTYEHYTRFGDPKFDYGVALAQTGGRLVLRLANADVLPFEPGGFSDTLAVYVKEVTKLAEDEREDIAEQNRRIQDRTFEAFFDPTKPFVAPTPEAAAPFLNFSPLQNALARVQESVKRYESARKDRASAGPALDLEQRKALDSILMGLERSLTRKEGLPGRPWFTHQIYAPGLNTGYGVKTLPAVREAIEQHQWKEAEEQISIAARTLEGFAAEVDRAAALLQPAPAAVPTPAGTGR